MCKTSNSTGDFSTRRRRRRMHRRRNDFSTRLISACMLRIVESVQDGADRFGLSRQFCGKCFERAEVIRLKECQQWSCFVACFLLQYEEAWSSLITYEVAMAAIAGGHDEIALWLMEEGVPIDSVDRRGWTTLFFAADKGRPFVVRIALVRLRSS